MIKKTLGLLRYYSGMPGPVLNPIRANFFFDYVTTKRTQTRFSGAQKALRDVSTREVHHAAFLLATFITLDFV